MIPDRVVAATYLAAVGPGRRRGRGRGRPAPTTWRCCCASWAPWACEIAQAPDGLRAVVRGPAPRGRRRHPALPGGGHRLQAVAGHHAVGGRRRRHRHREPLLRPVPLRRRAAPDGGRHPHRGPPRRGARGAPGCRARRCGPPTSGPGPPWCWPAWWPRARPRCPGPTTSTAATRTWPGRCARSGAGVTPPLSPPAEPDVRARCSLDAAAAGDRVALARLLSMVERGGATGPGRGRPGLPRRRRPTRSGSPGRRGPGKSTLTDRLITAARGGWPAEARRPSRSTRWPCWPSTPRRRSPAAPSWATGSACRSHATRPRRLHPVDGHPGPPGRAGPGRARRRPGARAPSGCPLVLVETVGVGPDGGRGGLGHRHHGGGGQPRVGRRDAGQQGRAARDGRHLRHQQGGPPGRARGPPGPRADARPVGRRRDWRPPVVETVAADGEGVDELWAEVARHRAYLVDGGLPGARRAGRLERELRRVLVARLARRDRRAWAGRGLRRGSAGGGRGPARPLRGRRRAAG